jgi:AcrR family transcriptional regulator
MATQKERLISTKAQLLTAFRTAFLESGFAATTTQAVLSEIGMSKGAMYHHFQSKSDIIKVLYEVEVRTAFERAVKAVKGGEMPLCRLEQIYVAWIEEVRAPGVSKILFEVGPSAIGYRKAKEIDEKICLSTIEGLLTEAMAVGEIASCDTELTAALLNALVAEAAVYHLRTGKDTTPLLKATLNGVFASLRLRA